VTQAVVDGTGQLYARQANGVVSSVSGTKANQVAAGVTAMAVDSAGEVVTVQGNSSYSYLISGIPVSGGVTSSTGAAPQYAVDDHGNLYTLFQGTLTSVGSYHGKSQTVATGVTYLTTTPSGAVFALQGPSTYMYFDNGIGSSSSSPTATYAMDAAGNFYTLQSTLLTIRYVNGTTSVLGIGYSQMAQLSSGAIFLTNASGMAFTGTRGVFTQVGTWSVVASDGSIWYLGTDGAGDYAIHRLSSGELTTVCVTSTDIGSKWLGMGGPSSSLGMPTGNLFTTDEGASAQLFTNGIICQLPGQAAQAMTFDNLDPSVITQLPLNGVYVFGSTLLFICPQGAASNSAKVWQSGNNLYYGMSTVYPTNSAGIGSSSGTANMAPLNASLIKQIRFYGFSGDNQFVNASSIPCVAYGGTGSDTLEGDSGKDTLVCGSGNETLIVRGKDSIVGFQNGDQIIANFQPMTGLIASKWLATGGLSGAFGLPTRTSGSFKQWSWVDFANGAIYSDGSTTYTLSGPIWTAYKAAGQELSSLGFPTGNPFMTADGGTAQQFVNGTLVWSPKLGTTVQLPVDPSGLALQAGTTRDQIINVIIDWLVNKYEPVVQQQLTAAYNGQQHDWTSNWGHTVTESVPDGLNWNGTLHYRQVTLKDGQWQRWGFGAPQLLNVGVSLDTTALSHGTIQLTVKLAVDMSLYYETQLWEHGIQVADIPQHGSVHISLDTTLVLHGQSHWDPTNPLSGSAQITLQGAPFEYAVLLDSGTTNFFKSPPDYIANSFLVMLDFLDNCPFAQVFANVATQSYINNLAPATLTWAVGASASGLILNAALSHPLFGTKSWTESMPF
jgi:hypothetical protein